MLVRNLVVGLLLCASAAAQQTKLTQVKEASFEQPSGNPQAPARPARAPFNATNFLSSDAPFACVEAYLSADAAHHGTDYGAAISAAVQAASLTSTTQVNVCAPGDHPVYTTAVFDRPIAFHMDGKARLIPQASLSSAPVAINGATATAGSTTLLVPANPGLEVGMAVGGVGLPPGAYVTALNGRSVSISLPATLEFYAIAKSASPTITGVSSMSGLTVGQTLNGVNTWPFVTGRTTITAIDHLRNTLTASSSAITSSSAPTTFGIGGSWTTNLTFVKTQPVLNFIYNAAALHNNFGQMYGSSMHQVWIDDTSGLSPRGPGNTDLPGYSGLQGVQIAGYDGFASYDLRVENIQGTALLIGGMAPETYSGGYYGPTRESVFYGDQIRNSGDAHSGQAAVAIMTPREGKQAAADESNELNFVGTRIVYSNGPALNIGTYNTSHTGNFGPGGIHFTGGFQIEGWAKNADTPAPSDVIVIQRAGDVHFTDGNILVAGQGKALINVSTVYRLTLNDVVALNVGVAATYQVTMTHGSATVAYIGGGGRQAGFNTTQTWDGIGVTIGGANTWLAPLSPVASDGRTLTLAAPWTGATGKATMAAGFGGIMVEASHSIGHMNFGQIQYPVLDAGSLSLLGNPLYTQLFEVGAAFSSGSTFTEDHFNRSVFSQGPTQFGSYGPVPDTSRQGSFQTWNQANHAGAAASITGETDFVNIAGEGRGGHCFYNVMVNGTLANALACFTPAGGLRLSGPIEARPSADSAAAVITPYSDTSTQPDIVGTNAARSAANWSIGKSGYSFGGSAGFTGVKTAGPCTFTIKGGIITSVTGC